MTFMKHKAQNGQSEQQEGLDKRGSFVPHTKQPLAKLNLMQLISTNKSEQNITI